MFFLSESITKYVIKYIELYDIYNSIQTALDH